MDEFYNDESTSASFLELLNFLEWCQKKLKAQPFIVGGWAVYAFAKKQKSLDIDVVFRTTSEMEKAMKKFFEENGYKKEELHDQQIHFAKIIKGKKSQIFIRFDTYSFEQENRLNENNSIHIEWKLLKENNTTKETNGHKIKVPVPELLLIFKAKALRDRLASLDIRGIQISPAQRARIKSKIRKDAIDIKDIVESTAINKTKLEALLAQTKFKKYFEDILKEYQIQA